LDNYHKHGNDVYSYETCILTRTDEGVSIVNRTFYSKTTLRHLQDAIRSGYLETLINYGTGKFIVNLYDVPIGASAEDLKKLAIGKRVVNVPLLSNKAASSSESLDIVRRAPVVPVAASHGDEELRPTL
jgi:hypothetical protein